MLYEVITITYSSNSLHTAIDLILDSNAVLAFPASMEPFFLRYGLVSLTMKESHWKGTIGIYLRRASSDDPHFNDLLALIRHYSEQQRDALAA